jgi:hypothetical protein
VRARCGSSSFADRSGRRAVRAVTFALALTFLIAPLAARAQAKFGVVRVELVFVNRRADITVPLRYPHLRAYAMVRFSGNGVLRATWKIDDRLVGTVVEPTILGDGRIIASPELSTVEPGLHRVTLDIADPRPAFRIPEITYFVTAEDYEEFKKKHQSER